jgi:hypothetical protein
MTTDRLTARVIFLVLTVLLAACNAAAPSSTPLPTAQPTVVPPSGSPAPTDSPSSAPPVPSATAGGWQAVGSMVFPRLDARAALLKDGTVLLVGNAPCVAAGEPTGSERTEVFDPATGAWTAVGSLNKARADLALVALPDGGAMALGGTNLQSQPYSSTKVYSPTSRTWSDGPLMLRAGATAAVTLANGDVLAVGPSRAEILQQGASAWRQTTQPPSGFRPDRLYLLDEGAAIARGERADEPGIATFLEFDTGRATWGGIEPPNVLRPEAVMLPGTSILALGDDEGGGHVERYDYAKDAWVETAQMAQGRIRAQVTLLPDGRVLVAGGVALTSTAVTDGYQVTEGDPLASTEIYDPAKDTWTAGPKLLSPRQGGHAITLADGSVLVFGGYVKSPPPDTGGDTGNPSTCPTPLATTERLGPSS